MIEHGLIEHAMTCLSLVAVMCSWHYWCAREVIERERARQHKNECIKEMTLSSLENPRLTSMNIPDME